MGGRRKLTVGGGVFVVVIVSGVASLFPFSEGIKQPVAFTHAMHMGLNMSCISCHTGAAEEMYAGVPSVRACALCHRTERSYPSTPPELVKYLEGNEEIPWIRLFALPDYVYFSHKRHAKAQIACEVCHEEVGQSTQPIPGIKFHGMDLMNTCVDCHKQKQARMDCFTCHR
jgi:c(7)-type cytochrome triheme protein